MTEYWCVVVFIKSNQLNVIHLQLNVSFPRSRLVVRRSIRLWIKRESGQYWPSVCHMMECKFKLILSLTLDFRLIYVIYIFKLHITCQEGQPLLTNVADTDVIFLFISTLTSYYDYVGWKYDFLFVEGRVVVKGFVI